MDISLLSKKTGIYAIVNKITKDFYIGSTKKAFRDRWAGHKSSIKVGKGCPILQKAWNKYGENSFEFIVIEIIKDKEKIIEREQFYIDFLKPKYNANPIAGSNKNRKWTEEQKHKMSNIQKNTTENNGRFKKGYVPPRKGKYKTNLCECGSQKAKYIVNGRFRCYRKTCGSKECLDKIRIRNLPYA